MARKHSAYKRRCFILAAIALSCVLLEIISFALYYYAFDKVFSYAETSAQYNTAIASYDTPNGAEPDNKRDSDAVSNHSYFLLHPYLGFIRNPQSHKNISIYGFRADEEPLIASHDPNVAMIGVTGGSVAQNLYNDRHSRSILREALEKLPAFQDKRIVFILLGCVSYKQPQQYFSVAYFLLMGGRLDLVINLDGKNDATYPSMLQSQGIYPLFPYYWGALLPDNYSPDAIARLGEVMMWKHIRYTVAKIFRHLHFSITATTLWSILDRIFTRHLSTESQLAFLEKATAHKPYYIAGPDTLDHAAQDEVDTLSINTWFEGSIELQHLAASHHFNYFHFLQPNQYVQGSKQLTEQEATLAFNESTLDSKTVSRLYPQFIQRIEQLHAEGVKAYSLTDVFKGTHDTIYIDTCCHVNDLGNDLMAHAIAEHILADFNTVNVELEKHRQDDTIPSANP